MHKSLEIHENSTRTCIYIPICILCVRVYSQIERVTQGDKSSIEVDLDLVRNEAAAALTFESAGKFEIGAVTTFVRLKVTEQSKRVSRYKFLPI